MGYPVDCENAQLVVNGTFDNAANWILQALWQISGGTAHVSWNAPTLDINCFQLITIHTDHWYRIEFDVLEAVCPGTSGLIVRLGGGGGDHSAVIKTTGHKTVYLKDRNRGDHLLFFIFQADFPPGTIKIDNAQMWDFTQYLACVHNILGVEDVLYEFWDVGANFVVIRYARDGVGSNILVKIDITQFPDVL